jgi:hypothetical protein
MAQSEREREEKKLIMRGGACRFEHHRDHQIKSRALAFVLLALILIKLCIENKIKYPHLK